MYLFRIWKDIYGTRRGVPGGSLGIWPWSLWPILMLVDAYMSLMPATANCTLVSLLVL